MKRLIILLGLLICSGVCGSAWAENHAQESLDIHVGMQSVGTFSWVMHAMDHFGIAEEHHLNISATTYASKQATEIAIRSGEADIIVNDFLGVMLMRANGIAAQAIYPYSLATGGLVVPADSDIASIADLQGKTLVAPSFGDKSLLILRALALAEYDFDPQNDGEVITAAPYLLGKAMGDGDAHAALPYWHFVARLTSTGEYRDLMMVTDMLASLGLPSDLPILVVVARDELSAAHKSRFLAALAATTARMQDTPQDDPFWQSILDQELYSLPNPEQFPAVIERWKSGAPSAWTEETLTGMYELFDSLLEIAGSDILGIDTPEADAYTLEYLP